MSLCLLLGLPALADAQDAGTTLFGNAGGLRPALAAHGISIGVNDSENLLGNLSGGVKQGATLQGVTTARLSIDTGNAFGLAGGSLQVSALQIHGQPFSGGYLNDLQPANGNEAEDGTRLWELWYDQAVTPKLDVKLGQQSIDNEFMSSTNSGVFINTMAGWPLIPSDDLYGGGPAYPLSSPGIRLQTEPTGSATMLAGVFDDNPGGGSFGDDAQFLDRNGGRFNLGTGALFIAEVQYATKLNGLAGTYKVGGWYDTGAFPDQRFDTDGHSLASAASSGEAALHHGNYSIYGIVDQAVWTSGTARRLNMFGRIMGAPDAQNLVDFSFNGGLVLNAPLPGRDGDFAGVDLGLGHVSSRAAGLDRDSFAPARGTEALIELTYQAQATPWLILQPNAQFIVNPGAGILDPDDTTHRLRNEFVTGLRAVVTF